MDSKRLLELCDDVIATRERQSTEARLYFDWIVATETKKLLAEREADAKRIAELERERDTAIAQRSAAGHAIEKACPRSPLPPGERVKADAIPEGMTFRGMSESHASENNTGAAIDIDGEFAGTINDAGMIYTEKDDPRRTAGNWSDWKTPRATLCAKWKACELEKFRDRIRQERASRSAPAAKADPCEKCGGAGWLWGTELNIASEDTVADTMTKYPCDGCDGTTPSAPEPVTAGGAEFWKRIADALEEHERQNEVRTEYSGGIFTIGSAPFTYEGLAACVRKAIG